MSPDSVQDVVDAHVFSTYQGLAFSEIERLRTRAQTAFSISTAVAAILGFGALTAGLAENFEDEAVGTVVLIFIAATLWVAAAILSVVATSWDVEQYKGAPSPGQSMDRDKSYEHISTWAAHETRVLTGRLRWGVRLIVLATLVTLAAIISSVAWTDPPEKELVEAMAILSPAAEAALDELCEVHFSPIIVRIDLKDLDNEAGDAADEEVRTELPSGSCQNETAVRTSVRRADLLSLVWR